MLVINWTVFKEDLIQTIGSQCLQSARVLEKYALKEQGQYRVIYIANFEDAVYVLHAFQKKTQKTSARDIDAAKRALTQVQERLKHVNK